MSGAPRVVHVVHSLATGGLENGVINLVNNAGPEFRHSIVCMTAPGAMRYRVNPNVDVHALGKRPGQDPAAFVRLVRLLRRLRPAVVHTRNWAAYDAIPAARLARVRAVVHSEHGREMADPEGRNARRNRIRRLLGPLVTQFVTVSHDLGRWLVSEVRLPAGKVMTIHNGVDLSGFGRAGRREGRELLGLPDEAVAIGTVGRLDPVKDQAGLLQAFAQVRPAHPTASLVIVGEGPCRAEIEGLAVELGVKSQVRLLGESRNVPLLLGAMDLFVLPSIAEGLSNTLLEAMASGLPVVATRVGGNVELVEDGVGGCLVPARDVPALARALAAYLDDPHLGVVHGKASRQRAVEYFGLERMCGAYTQLYARLLAGRAAQVA